MRQSGRLGLLCLLVLAGGVAHGQVVAYQVPSGVVGNQTSGGTVSIGMDFNVVTPIRVTQLGVFDSGSDGLIAPLQAAIYDRSSQLLAAPVLSFAAGTGATSGTLNGGSRFLDVTPIDLPAGFQGTIVVYGYGNGTTADANGNTNGAPAPSINFPWTTNDGGGEITFVGAGRYSPGGGAIQFPANIDGGPDNRYAAGTFTFTPVPEPGSMALVATTLMVGMGVRRLRARRASP